jgi:hypothetical protein
MGTIRITLVDLNYSVHILFIKDNKARTIDGIKSVVVYILSPKGCTFELENNADKNG